MIENPMSEPKCPTVRNTEFRTPGHRLAVTRTASDSSGQPSLKSLARKVLQSALHVGQASDSSRQQLSENTLLSDPSSDTPLEARKRRLAAANIFIAVLDSGEMRVVQTEPEIRDAIEREFTIYSPQDMYFYIQLEP